MLLHRTVCRRYMIFPQVREDGRIVVAIPGRGDEQRVRVVLAEHGITQCEIERRDYDELLELIDRYYPPEMAEAGSSNYDQVKQIIRAAAANGIEDSPLSRVAIKGLSVSPRPSSVHADR
jgi:hypothetical protein